MLKPLSLSMLALAVIAAGCSGPAYKLGRGVNNVSELTRWSDTRRSMEQAAIWEGPHAPFAYGFFEGVSRSLGRAALGVVEIATFPIPTPSYDPIYAVKPLGKETDVYVAGPRRRDQFFSLDYMTKAPSYPANYTPSVFADGLFATDTALGFSGGDVAPFIPGSRFHIFNF